MKKLVTGRFGEIRDSALTPEQRKAFQEAARRTWQAIGFDVLQAVAESEGKDVNRVSMKRDEVIEVVLDADHMTTNGGLRDPDLVEFYHYGNYVDKIRLLKPVFYATEGM